MTRTMLDLEPPAPDECPVCGDLPEFDSRYCSPACEHIALDWNEDGVLP